MALNLMGILREALLIFSKNGKLMASITLLALALHSVFYFSLTFSTKPLIADLVFKSITLISTSPGTPEYAALLIGVKHDFGDITGIEWICFLAQSFTSVFFAAATIFASAVIYDGKNISLKYFLSRILKSCIRPFITWVYIVLFGGGVVLLVLAVMLPILLLVESPVVLLAVFVAVFIAATVFYCYLYVEFVLALVVSVIEEKSGIEALGKAGEIVKGRKLQGFALNILFTIIGFIVMQGLMLVGTTMSIALQTLISLLVVYFVYLFQMYWFMTYTVYYYQCKNGHGEEVTLQGNMEYKQIPTAPLINEYIP